VADRETGFSTGPHSAAFFGKCPSRGCAGKGNSHPTLANGMKRVRLYLNWGGGKGFLLVDKKLAGQLRSRRAKYSRDVDTTKGKKERIRRLSMQEYIPQRGPVGRARVQRALTKTPRNADGEANTVNNGGKKTWRGYLSKLIRPLHKISRLLRKTDLPERSILTAIAGKNIFPEIPKNQQTNSPETNVSQEGNEEYMMSRKTRGKDLAVFAGPAIVA